MTIFDGGYQSTTTKSRLNALCDAFCVDGEEDKRTLPMVCEQVCRTNGSTEKCITSLKHSQTDTHLPEGLRSLFFYI